MRYSIIALVVIFLSSANQLVIAQENLVVHSVYFESDKHELPLFYFDSLLISWNLNTIDSLVIDAFCDSDGSNEYNLKLAERRLRFVLSRLDEKGFSSQHKYVKTNILGESSPKYPNNTEGNKLKNRRVDIRYVEKPKVVAKQDRIPTALENLHNESPAAALINTPMTEDILNQRIEESLKTGDNIALEDILFRPGLDVFQPNSMSTLEVLFKVLSARKDLVIEIQGHVCCVGEGQSDGSNYRNGSNHLSEDRAEAVKEYLINLGINPKRVRTKGFGGSKRLIYPELTEADMARNRRVEIKVLLD